MIKLKSTELTIGQLAPEFTLPSHQDTIVSLADYRGKWVILYFYPKDNTPGCTKESCDFSKRFSVLANCNAVILGVSKDSVAKHKKFQEKYHFPFLLLSDEKQDTCEQYGVWKDKTLFGKKYKGIERTTVLIDPTGHIAEIWHKVKVIGHVKAVEKYLEKIVVC